MTSILCPNCPVCGEPPSMAMSPVQAFCSNTDCPSFSWNMTKTKDENLDGVNFINLNLNPKADG